MFVQIFDQSADFCSPVTSLDFCENKSNENKTAEGNQITPDGNRITAGSAVERAPPQANR